MPNYRELADNKELPKEPLVTVTGPIDSNAFVIIGTVKRALQRGGFREEAIKYSNQAMNAGSYEDMLAISQSYADFDI